MSERKGLRAYRKRWLRMKKWLSDAQSFGEDPPIEEVVERMTEIESELPTDTEGGEAPEAQQSIRTTKDTVAPEKSADVTPGAGATGNVLSIDNSPSPAPERERVATWWHYCDSGWRPYPPLLCSFCRDPNRPMCWSASEPGWTPTTTVPVQG